LLVVTLFFQFRLRRYVAWIYWTGIVLISIVGTQITDNLSDNYGVSLVTTTTIFSIVLAVVFAVWFASERTLSIHTIHTTRREGFYWLAVLFTFALGTAAGDLMAERLNIGYAWSLVIFAGAIALVAALHYGLNMNAVLSFWIAYILTRPLGASTGDLLSQPRADGGLALGTTVTSLIFLSAILIIVAFLSITKRDVTESAAIPADDYARVLVVANQTATNPTLLDAIRERSARGPVHFHLLIPSPAAHAELTEVERERAHTEAIHMLTLALPLIDDAAGSEAGGSVSSRHDPMDAIEETLHNGHFDEIMLATLPHGISGWLHVDLPHRVSHLGLPVTTITAKGRVPAAAEPAELVRSRVG